MASLYCVFFKDFFNAEVFSRFYGFKQDEKQNINLLWPDKLHTRTHNYIALPNGYIFVHVHSSKKFDIHRPMNIFNWNHSPWNSTTYAFPIIPVVSGEPWHSSADVRDLLVHVSLYHPAMLGHRPCHLRPSPPGRYVAHLNPIHPMETA